MVQDLVLDTLIKMGVNVICLDLSTTPTVEIAVPIENADAGIIITASHNPKEWNALKFLNNKGECLSANSILDVINRSESISVNFPKINELCIDGLDVLCNNAGVMALKDKATIDGFDVQMQTNHLSHFLLTKLCMALLEKASQLRDEARIVNHSSIARFQTKRLKEKFLEKRTDKKILTREGKRFLFD